MVESMTRMHRSECVGRLAAGTVGRVGVTARAMPVIIPVNYVLDGDAVVFRTTADGLLASACDGNVVAFEVDELAPDGTGGWSVLVVGVAQLLPAAEAEPFKDSPAPAVGDGRDQVVRIGLTRVSGRRIGTDAVPDRYPAHRSPAPSPFATAATPGTDAVGA
jgi:hypothetical protein